MKDRVKSRIPALICLMLTGAVALLTACRDGSTASGEIPELLEPKGISMAAVPVERGDLYITTELSVTVVPYTEKLFFEPISGETSARVSQIRAVPGEMVNEGDVLIQLDTTDVEEAAASQDLALQYAKEQYSFALEQAQQEVNIAQLEYDAALAAAGEAEQAEKSAREAEPGTVTEEELAALKKAQEDTAYVLAMKDLALQQAKASLEQVKGTWTTDILPMQTRLEELKAACESLELKAPFSGRVVEVYPYENQWVDAFDTLVILADESRVFIQGEAYNNTAIINAKQIDARIDGRTVSISYQEYDSEDYLKRKLSGEELPTVFLPAEGEIGSLTFGQTGVVRVCTDYSLDTLLVPVACLESDSAGSFVYARENGQRVKVYVSVGLKGPIMAEILSGLEEGAQVYVGD
ncbi:MAG: efflux RND transporter periplasmic adaptor subunit [Lachnospiraceae bacterium]|nr:efflux RND transporter periplasmic adaptor subunit [Lachnospiraceae bacterium]